MPKLLLSCCAALTCLALLAGCTPPPADQPAAPQGGNPAAPTSVSPATTTTAHQPKPAKKSE